MNSALTLHKIPSWWTLIFWISIHGTSGVSSNMVSSLVVAKSKVERVARGWQSLSRVAFGNGG